MEKYFVRRVTTYLTPVGHFDDAGKAWKSVCAMCLNDCIKNGVIFLDCAGKIIKDFNNTERRIYGIIFPNSHAFEFFKSILDAECIADEWMVYRSALQEFFGDNDVTHSVIFQYFAHVHIAVDNPRNYFWYDPDLQMWHDFLEDMATQQQISGMLDGILAES